MRASRQETLLLLGGAGELQRFRHTDRLMGRQQRPDAGVHAGDDRQGPVVGDLRQPETAVLLRDLHAETAELGQFTDVFVGYPRVAFDAAAVHRTACRAQAREELLGAGILVGSRSREGVNEVEGEPSEEQFLREGRLVPLGFAGLLRYFASLPLGYFVSLPLGDLWGSIIGAVCHDCLRVACLLVSMHPDVSLITASDMSIMKRSRCEGDH